MLAFIALLAVSIPLVWAILECSKRPDDEEFRDYEKNLLIKHLKDVNKK